MSSSSFDAAARFLGDIFGASNENRVYLCTLPNGDAPPGEPGEQHILTYDYDERADAFVRHWDRANRGVYFCVNLLAESATKRAKGTVAELTGLYCDIDFKDVEETQQQVWDAISSLHLAPSKVVRTGHGFHCYWLFQETLPATTPNTAKVEQLLRQLCRHLAGDKSVCEISRLMRLPSSHNTKSGEWTSVDVIIDNPARYAFMELFEWLKDALPVLTRKASAAPAGAQDAPKTNGHANDHGADNAFLEFAAGAGTPPIDVDARLAAMKHQGPGDSSIHLTQLAVSASLTSRGVPIPEVVQTIFDATCTAAGAVGNSWNWTQERQNIEKMCRDWLTKHPEIGEREKPKEDSNQADSKTSKNTLPLIPFREIVLSTTSTYTVKGVIPRSGIVIIWGPPKCGKSFWTFDLVMHVALGWGYRGRRICQGPVVYCAFEGADGFRARVEAFRRAHDIDPEADVPFYLSPLRIEIVKRHAALIAAIRAKLGDKTPAVVVLDTLNRSMTGSESKDEDMTAYLNAADAIREAFACAVLIVHHCGVDGTRPRGHSSLTGAADAQLSVARDDAGDIVATVEYLKDGPEGAMFVSKLESKTLDLDEDGDVMTSCVVREVDGEVAQSKKAAKPKKAEKIPKTAQIALRALTEAVSECGEPAPASNHIPKDVKVTTIERWRDYAYRMGISTGETRAQQKAFKEASEYLISASMACVWGKHVWPVQPNRTNQAN